MREPIPTHPDGSSKSPEGIVFLILAHNEELVLERSLTALALQLENADRIHIVADRCDDRTAQLAQGFSAEVYIRNEPAPYGKGAALGWWVERQRLEPEQPIIIIDADSIVQHGFVNHVRKAFQRQEIQALQTGLNPISDSNTPISAVIALSERIDQGFFDALRHKLGGSVRLRGTGMGFRFRLLQSAMPEVRTNVEDVELTLLLAGRGVRIHSVPAAVLDDPKPEDPDCAAQQRARWFQGHIRSFRTHLPSVIRLLPQGPLSWWLLYSLLTKPRTLSLPVRVIATVITSIWASGVNTHWVPLFLCVFLVVDLTMELIAFQYAVFKLHDRHGLQLAVRGLPAFTKMWVEGIIRSARPQTKWLRVRPLPIIRQKNESAQQSS